MKPDQLTRSAIRLIKSLEQARKELEILLAESDDFDSGLLGPIHADIKTAIATIERLAVE